MDDLQKLNPQITQAEVGKKTVRSISILPLSAGDQSVVLDKIIGVLSAGMKSWGAMTNTDVLTQLKQEVFNNLQIILEKVLDPEEMKIDILWASITNDQLLKVVDIIWEKNFSDPFQETGKKLWEKVKILFPSVPSLPQSQSDTASPSGLSLDRGEKVV